MRQKVVVTLIFVLSAVLQSSAAVIDSPIVHTPLATVRGFYKTSYEGRRYEAYEGVAYALPPTGSRRFQPPQPITTPSKEVISAMKDPNMCIQFDYHSLEISGEEDCLYLNIYTPSSDNSLSLPVLFWIHEGAFQRGSGNYTKAKYIVDKNVVLVTINYRLGAFGFLSTEDDLVSGNMGLKDQNMALRWVRQNIRHFGGDPKKISLVGASAGGSSVHLHYLSKMSAGLFRNGISFSGTALSPWAFDPQPLDTAINLAKKVGCAVEKTLDMVECLRELSAMTISNATGEILRELTSLYYYYPLFVPVAEKGVDDYFINRSPEEILRSGDVYDVPWTTTDVSEEGGSTISSIFFNEKALTYTDKNWEHLTPYTLMYERRLPKNRHAEIARAARKFYIGNEAFSNDSKTLWGLLYMKTHESFFIVMEKSARLQALANRSPVYTYLYSYRAADSQTNSLSNTHFNFGVSHLDDIFLVLENNYINPTKKSKDKEMLQVMLNFWYSAVTKGKPDVGVEWPRLDPKTNAFQFMHIAGPHNITMETNDNFGQKKFWNSLGF